MCQGPSYDWLAFTSAFLAFLACGLTLLTFLACGLTLLTFASFFALPVGEVGALGAAAACRPPAAAARRASVLGGVGVLLMRDATHRGLSLCAASVQ